MPGRSGPRDGILHHDELNRKERFFLIGMVLGNRRFKSMFGENGDRWPKVKPYFGLVSPREPEGLRYELCPSWLKVDDKIPWFKMSIPEDRLTLFGCDEQGRPNEARAFWTVKQRKLHTSG